MALKDVSILIDGDIIAKMQIQAEEDQRIFLALDGIAMTCYTEGHPGYGDRSLNASIRSA